MSALLKSFDRLGTLVVNDIKRRVTERNQNGHGSQLPVQEDKQESCTQETTAVSYRRSDHYVLMPTMVGAQLVLVPRPKHGRGLDWPTWIHAKE